MSETTTETKQTPTALREQARQAATQTLKSAHKEEFDGYFEVECEARNVPFKRRLSPKERAEQQMKALLAEFPDLASEVTPTEA